MLYNLISNPIFSLIRLFFKATILPSASHTWNPARQIHALDRVGSIANGKLADFVVCDAELNRKAVWLGGKQL